MTKILSFHESVYVFWIFLETNGTCFKVVVLFFFCMEFAQHDFDLVDNSFSNNNKHEVI